MKKYILAFIAMFTMAVSTNAMGYEQARIQALFLTDKMAYELNLTEEQYEAAYEINLDYLMSVNTADDLYGAYWTHRNLDLSYILLDWQYRSFVEASYFYRPLWWDAGNWHFGIYARYPRRDYFYFGRPHFYTAYRGGHSWRMNGGRSWYNGRSFADPSRNNGRQFGMRDGFQRGDYRNGFDNARSNNIGTNTASNGHRSFGNQHGRNFGGSRSRANTGRQSSTRTTVTTPSNRQFGGSRSFGGSTTRQAPSRSFTPSRGNRPTGTPNRSFGGGASRSAGSSRFGGHR
ncbi:hypothetical protein [Prevotella sp. HUN102]|uniref:hypothetical protein n=1 Tax=Prevotella sp. HUN102 TaxID=1392486 RepID=UPI0004908969|nr:hypothetical protein [Prevotella sp. HUN102]